MSLAFAPTFGQMGSSHAAHELDDQHRAKTDGEPDEHAFESAPSAQARAAAG